jgi:hypothetical protein
MDERTKDFYKKYPDCFLENFLGVKLFWYQKILIRALTRKEKIMSNQTENYIILKPIAERFNRIANSITDDEIK